MIAVILEPTETHANATTTATAGAGNIAQTACVNTATVASTAKGNAKDTTTKVHKCVATQAKHAVCAQNVKRATTACAYPVQNALLPMGSAPQATGSIRAGAVVTFVWNALQEKCVCQALA